MKLDKRRSRKRDAETLAQQTMSGAHAQRAEPQPPQPFIRKRTIEPERSRLLAVAATRDENRHRRRRKPAKRKRKHRRRRRIQPLHIIDRDQQRPPPRSPRSWNTANAIARSSGTDPSTSSSSKAAESARRCGNGNRSSPSGNTGLNRSASAANENAASAPAGRHEKTANPCSRASATAASNSVVFPIPASPSSTSASGASPPSREKLRQHRNLGLTAHDNADAPRARALRPRNARGKPQHLPDQDRRA